MEVDQDTENLLQVMEDRMKELGRIILLTDLEKELGAKVIFSLELIKMEVVRVLACNLIKIMTLFITVNSMNVKLMVWEDLFFIIPTEVK